VRRLIKLCLVAFSSFFCLTVPFTVWASSPVVCQSSAEYRVSIYRSALPSSFTNHTITFVSPVDGNGDIIPITSSQVTLKYDGVATQIVCNGSAQDFIPATSYTEIQNKVTCTIEDGGEAVKASFVLYDLDVYSSPYSTRPSDSSFPELSGTSEAVPYCHAEGDDLACEWQEQNVGNNILNQRNIPLNNWVVYGKTTANNLTFVNNVEGTAPYSESDYICAYDINGNGNVDTGEMDACIQIGQAYLCPVDMVECIATYGVAICPTGSTLNIDTDKCEAAPDIITCPAGYTYNPEIDTCVMDVSCPDGGGLNPNSDLCEIVVTSDLCPSGYTYNSAIDACTKTVVCPGNGIYSSLADQCELPPDHSCPDGYSYNSSRNICEVSPVCSQGTYNISTNRCELGADEVCPTGYTYNSSAGECVITSSCPGSGSLNTSRDKCETVYGHDCPTGYTYSSSLNLCQKMPVCSQGTYNTSTNRCELGADEVCPTGYTYNSSAGKCVITSSCPNGGSLNTTRDKCEIAYTPGCVSGYTYNSSSGKCEASPVCPSGSSYNTTYNVCLEAVSSTTCPTGYIYNSSSKKCEKAPTCPSESLYNTTNNRCEMAEQWYCSENGGTYSSQSTCNSNCIQTGTCTEGQNCVTKVCWTGGMNGPVCSVGGSCLAGADESTWNWEWFYDHVPPCPGGNTPPPGSTVTGVIYSYHGMYLWIPTLHCHDYQSCTAAYTCSLTSSSYSTLSTCNSNCSQGTSCSSTCPTGYTKSGSLCIANSTCSSSGTLNTSTDKCEYAPTYNCDSGYTYDAAIEYCKINATCNSSGTLDTSVDKCQLSYSYSCPSGYSYNSTYGVCQVAPVCPTGSAYDASLNQCARANTWSCPSGAALTGSTCYLSATCTDGSLNTTRDKCEVAYTPDCESGYTYNSSLGVCQVAPVCPSGSSYDTSLNQCARANTWSCPSGTTLTGSICYMSVYCPTDGGLNTDTELCEATSTLTCFTEGYSYSSTSNKCVTAPICNYGYFDSSIDLCRLSASGICPGTYTYNPDQNKCFSDPSCLSGALYSTTLNQCTIGAIHDCPDTTGYSSLTRLCEAYPMCEVGAYDANNTNSCYEGDNTCPYGPQYACLDYQGRSQCSAQECVQYGSAGEDQGTPQGTNDKDDDGETDEDGNCLGTVYIFNGHDRRCRSGGVTIGFQDCCVDEDYFFGLGQCKEEEKQLAHLKANGMCHEIGEYCSREISVGFADICIEHSKSYCCFNSKLGRVIQEQGRPQLKTFSGWGQAEGPYCRGMTPNEFQMVDFSRVDLSEWYGNIVTKSNAEIGNTMQDKVQNFYDNLE